MSEPVVTLKFVGENGQLIATIESSKKGVASFGAAAKASGEQAAGGFNKAAGASRTLSQDLERTRETSERTFSTTRRGVESISTQLGQLQKLGAGVAILGGARRLAAELSQAADEFTNLTSKIRNTTDSEAALLRVRERTFEIAQLTRSEYGSTVELYTRLTRATTALGLSEQKRLQITETINKSFQVSGASANEANNAIVQLAQGLSAGALRGDEFNSVAEQAPILMDLLARSLNMTRGELRAYAAEGKITAEVVTNALLEGGATVDEQFAKMAPTIEGATTQLKNALVAIIGGATEASGGAALVARAITLLAANLQPLMLVVEGTAIAVTVRLIPSLLTSASAMIGTQIASRALSAELGITAAAATGASRALALAGGWIGLLAVGVAAAVIGLQQLARAEAERRREFDAGISQMRDGAAAARALAAGLTEISLVPFKPLPNFDDALNQYTDNMDLLATKQAEYTAKRQELEAVEYRIKAVQQSSHEAAALQLPALAEKAARLREETGALGSEISGLQDGTDSLGAALGSILAPGFATVGREAIDMANKIASSRVAMQGLGTVAGIFGANVPAIGAAIRNGIAKTIEDGNAANVALGKSIADVEGKFKTFGLTQAQIIKKQLESVRASVQWTQASAKERAELEKKAGEAIAHAAAMDKSKKSTDDAAKAGLDFVARLHEQVATFGLTGAASLRYELSTKKLTAAKREEATAAIATLEAWERYAKTTKAAYESIDKLTDGNADLDKKLADARGQLDGLDDAQRKYNESLAEANRLAEDALALGPPTVEVQKLIEERLEKIAQLRDTERAVKLHEDTSRAALEAEREELRRSNQMWGDYADAVSDAVLRSGNKLRNLLANLRDVVSRMLAEWFRTRVIGLFGGGGVSLVSGMQMIGPSIIGAGVDPVPAGTSFSSSSGSGFDFRSPSSWMNAGRSFFSGFSNAFSASGKASSNWFGSYTPDAGTGVYNPTALGYGVSIAAGAYAGYNRWQNSGQDFGGALGGAAYGVGTAYAAIGTSAALSGGIAAGVAAIPVVGWIAIAAMLIDMFSGGKLFGTAFRPESATQSIGVSAEGGTASLSRTDVRQQAFFGGRKWREVAMDVPPEMRDAADRFFRTVTQAMQQAATASRSELAPMIEANIRTVTQFDKKGREKSTKYFVDALGRTWEEASSELAAKRVIAEAQIAQLASSAAGADASDVAERWRYSAEALSEGTQLLIAATSDIARGKALLGDGETLAATVDLVESLQQSEESLAQTYQRVSAATALLDQALSLSGISLGKTREETVRFAAAIADAAGGLQAAQQLWQGYFDAYYSESETAVNQIVSLQESASSQLQGIGLAANTSMDEFRAKFEAALPTLTPDQVVQWLQAGNALAKLTSAQAQLVQQVAAVLGPMGLMGRGLSEFGQTLVSIRQQGKAASDAANALARAQGAEGASAVQLSAIKLWTMRQEAAAVRQLVAETQRLVADLYGKVPGSLDAINQRIGELESLSGSVAGGIDSVAEAGTNLFEEWARGVQSVQDYLDSMLLGDLTNLTPEQQAEEAKRQLLDAQAAAMRGDTTALARLPQLADAFLRLQRDGLASGDDWNAQVDWVRQLLGTVAGMPNPGTPGGGNPGGGTTTVVASPELQALYEARDAALAAQEAEHRRVLAAQLTQHLSDLSSAIGVPIFELISAQGVNLRQLATDLGADLAHLTGASVEVLGNMAITLGVPLGELVQQLGLSLPDLKDGIVEMTKSLGIDLEKLTSGTAEEISATTSQLAALSGSLGTNLKELSKSLGVDLGKLTDVDSPIFVALRDNIATLSPDIKDELTPLLDAVRLASGDEEKNAAVKALRDHVDQLAPDIRAQLGPFFDDIFPVKSLNQLDFLQEIRDRAQDQLDVLGLIRDNLAAANRQAGIPSYAIGTGFVSSNQLANIHYGEAVVPSAVNSWFRQADWQLPRVAAANDDNGEIVRSLRRIEQRLESLERVSDAGAGKIARAVGDADTAARGQRDVMARELRSSAQGRSGRY